MRTLIDQESKIDFFEEIPPGYRGVFYSLNDDTIYEYCDVFYTLLPLEGRHTQSVYRLEITLTEEQTDTPNEVRDTVSTAVLDLETLDRGEHIKVKGWGDDNERLLVKHLHFSSDWDGHDASEYNYLQIRLEYLQQTPSGKGPDSETVERKRQSFQKQIDRRDDLAVDATAF